jgi:hypothetical protein
VVMEEFLRRFQKLGFGPPSAPPPAPALDPQDLERMIQNAVRAAMSGATAGDATAAPGDSAPAPEDTKPRGGRKPRGGDKAPEKD